MKKLFVIAVSLLMAGGVFAKSRLDVILAKPGVCEKLVGGLVADMIIDGEGYNRLMFDEPLWDVRPRSRLLALVCFKCFPVIDALKVRVQEVIKQNEGKLDSAAFAWLEEALQVADPAE